MKPDTKAAVEFLEKYRPGGPWVLTAITPDGPISTTTFVEGRQEAMRDWLDARVGKDNLYFQVNSSGSKRLGKKANKDDIVEADWLHVDVDPTVDDPELLEADRKRLLKKLKEYIPAPSLVIDSGGGFQGFWRLAEPVRVEDWAEFECYNRQIETDLAGGTQCYNVDRIMRLPGTINVPNKTKRKKGRKEALTKVVAWPDTVYDISAFPQAPMIDGGERGDVGRMTVEISGNLPKIDEPEELAKVAKTEIRDEIYMLIVNGSDVDNQDRWPSRSEAFWYVVCELVRCGVPDDYIAAVILDPDFAISGHCLDQKNPQGYAVRQIQRAKENAEDENLPGFNDDHFVTAIGGKVRVVREELIGNRRKFTFYERGSFEALYCNRWVEIGEDANGNPKFQELGKWWFKHPNRRQYLGGIVFDPGAESDPSQYNLWRGFSCKAVGGDAHIPYLDHIRDNICHGNEDHYNYLLNWMARVVQNPATQSETAIVLRGKEGTGKNTFVEVFGSLVQDHFLDTSKTEHIVGKFNSHLRGKLLVHANEAFFAGDKRHEADLKSLITEPTLGIEAKGIDITEENNFIHLVMSSNSEWVVPAGPQSRRYMVLDVSDAHMQDDQYFFNIKRHIRDGGREHLLRFLLDRDLSEFNVRRIPATKALREQRRLTMSPEVEWMYLCLDRGYIGHAQDGWVREILSDDAFGSYTAQMDAGKVNRRATQMKLSSFLKKHFKCDTIRRHVGSSNLVAFMMPPIEESRDMFDEQFGGPFEWTPLGDPNRQDDIPF